jgi:hypothetical protein
MAQNKKRNKLETFLSSEKKHPVLFGLATGLYPTLFYFSNNYPLVNTWGHVFYFIFYFLCCPVLLFLLANFIVKKEWLGKIGKYILPFLSAFIFLFLLTISNYAGLNYKAIIVVFVASLGFTLILNKQVKKIVVIQLILACIGLFTIAPSIFRQLNYSDEWMQQPDTIEKAVFTKRPNVYFIQPDGYANASELKKKNYNIDNSVFDAFLEENNFKYYNNFRSNYASTLSSNSATFMMKHHYYNKGVSFSEAIKTRNIIITKNTVLDIFKNNNYKTHFITELPYLLLNRPKIGYDECNFDYKNISYIGTGLGERKDIISPLRTFIETDSNASKFFFIEIFNPGHIHGNKFDTLGEEEERKLWNESLNRSNVTLTKTITTIKENDSNALIVIMADHGGFVGMDFTGQAYIKTQDRDKIYSIFTSILAIHWPDGNAPDFDTSFSSSVNIFRILFSYLCDDISYLEHLQPNESFVILKDEEFNGVYQYINDTGEIIFKAL